MRFNGSTAHLDAIADAGFNVVQAASNHTHDRGRDGLLHTLEAVRERGPTPVGTAGSVERLRADPVLVDVRGVRLGFRAYSIPPDTYLDAAGQPGRPPARPADRRAAF